MLESLRQSGLYEIFFIFSGIALYKILSAMFGAISMYKLYDHVLKNILLIISLAMFNHAIRYELVYKKLKENGVEEDKLEKIKQEDVAVLRKWADDCISSLIVFFPKAYKKLININSWHDAVKYLEKENAKNEN